MMSLLLSSAALFTALISAPVAPSQPDTLTHINADYAARAKAPKENAALVDMVAAINAWVNDHIQPESDMDHYGIEELWVMYPPDGKGDCEDYALTKLGMLSQIGWPTVSDVKVVGVIVHAPGDTEGHAILAVRFPHGTVLYLDNMNEEPMTRKELLREHYQFFDWRA